MTWGRYKHSVRASFLVGYTFQSWSDTSSYFLSQFHQHPHTPCFSPSRSMCVLVFNHPAIRVQSTVHWQQTPLCFAAPPTSTPSSSFCFHCLILWNTWTNRHIKSVACAAAFTPLSVGWRGRICFLNYTALVFSHFSLPFPSVTPSALFGW